MPMPVTYFLLTIQFRKLIKSLDFYSAKYLKMIATALAVVAVPPPQQGHHEAVVQLEVEVPEVEAPLLQAVAVAQVEVVEAVMRFLPFFNSIHSLLNY